MALATNIFACNQHRNTALNFTRIWTRHNFGAHGAATALLQATEDFRAHLDGRVTWVETVNRRRGLKLRQMFETIDWPDDEILSPAF